MIDFKKLMSEEYKEESKKRKEREEQEYQEFMELWKQTCCFTGHRPNKLGNCYSLKHPISLLIRDKFKPIIEDLINKEGVTRFISGGAIGVDQIAFWTVKTIQKEYPEIKNIVAKPFVNQDAVWKNYKTLLWYYKMLDVADEVINVEDLDKYNTNESSIKYGDFSNKKMQKRNEYMIDNSKYVIAVWDGSKGGTANCLWYARQVSLIPNLRMLYRLYPKYNYELEIRAIV